MSNYSRAKIRRLLAQSDNAATADEKGAKLEELVCYVFGKLNGVEYYDKNILDAARAQEIDVAFYNRLNHSDVCFLDAVIIVECKNTADPIGSADVGWFVRKLQDSGADNGILVALSGITGAKTGIDNAYNEVRDALIRDKIKIILINREEITGLTTTDDLVKLLINKYLQLTLRRAVV